MPYNRLVIRRGIIGQAWQLFGAQGGTWIALGFLVSVPQLALIAVEMWREQPWKNVGKPDTVEPIIPLWNWETFFTNTVSTALMFVAAGVLVAVALGQIRRGTVDAADVLSVVPATPSLILMAIVAAIWNNVFTHVLLTAAALDAAAVWVLLLVNMLLVVPLLVAIPLAVDQGLNAISAPSASAGLMLRHFFRALLLLIGIWLIFILMATPIGCLAGLATVTISAWGAILGAVLLFAVGCIWMPVYYIFVSLIYVDVTRTEARPDHADYQPAASERPEPAA